MRKDNYNGETWIRLDNTEIKIGFLAQCIESLAEKNGCDYINMLERLEQADMTQGYILKFYDTLHTQSWEAVIDELDSLLNRREAKYDYHG